MLHRLLPRFGIRQPDVELFVKKIYGVINENLLLVQMSMDKFQYMYQKETNIWP